MKKTFSLTPHKDDTVMQKKQDTIVRWLSAHTEAARAQGLVLGLSGGVDSATAAALCAKACGGDNVTGVLMPCESHSRDEKDARLCAESFGIRTVYVDLTDAYTALVDHLPEGTSLAGANIKPRLRMTTLYHIAQSNGCLVVGTGNKTELMVGYFTKYGDGGVDLLPLGALYKTEVRELARLLDVPSPIIEKKPSAGLWENQTDEDELGMSYDTLDTTLQALESGDHEGVDQQTLLRVRTMIEKSAHKRNVPPICEVSADVA
jgi:NAD+ synthase